MSEPVARQRPIINLDEFERRLRQPNAEPSGHDDPLSELARLVGSEQDPYLDVFQEHDQVPYQSGVRPGAPNVRPDPRQRAAPILPQAAPAQAAPRRPVVPAPVEKGLRAERPSLPQRVQAPTAGWQQERPQLRQSQSQAVPRRATAPSAKDLGGNFAAIEAGLRGSIQPDYRGAPQQQYSHDYREQYQEPPLDEDDDEHWLDQVQAAPPRPAVARAAASYAAARPRPAAAQTMVEPSNPRRLLYVTAAVVLVGIGGIGVVFASKHKAVSPQQIAMIKASTSPAKVQAPMPAQSAAADSALQDDAVFDKTPSPAPEGVVNRAEQPVDLPQGAGAQQSSDTSGPMPVPTPATIAPPWASSPQPAAPAKVQAPLAPVRRAVQQAAQPNPQLADVAPGEALALGGIQAKKVKTIAVRPDGSVAPDPAPTASTQPPSMQMPAGLDGAGPAANDPMQGDPVESGRAAIHKATTRVVPPPKTETPDDTGAAASDSAADFPVGAAPHKPAHPKPVKMADLDSSAAPVEAATTHSGGSEFAVQLAAPATEAEAHHTIAKLTHDYEAELAGHQLSLHHVKVGEKSVYRVRAGGLSKPAALKLCQALQAKGGSCFIAKD
jgi:hypothetical protein